MKLWLPTLILLFVSEIVLAQVQNDNIENRIELPFNQPVKSNTTNCTVQWDCVDQSLTGKEVQYHNDQWFYFKPKSDGQIFINISNQECKDLRGVQLVVIDGIPCQTDSYNILACVSLASQDDIFVELPALTTGKEYLINIDGYLNDHCSFQIEWSDRGKGLPLEQQPANTGEAVMIDSLVTLKWEVEDEYMSYEIHRKEKDEAKSRQVGVVTHSIDSYGKSISNYSFVDTVSSNGSYRFQVIGVDVDRMKHLLLQKTVAPHQRYFDPMTGYLKVSVRSLTKTSFKIIVYDADKSKLLFMEKVQLNNRYKELYLDVSRYIEQGIRNFRIETYNIKSKELTETLVSK